MKNTRATAYRNLTLAAALVAVLSTTTACSDVSFSVGDRYDKTQSYAFDDMLDDDARQILPAWVPSTATDIAEVQRTTGHERIFTLALAEPLPSGCVELATPGEPTSDELRAGLTESGWREAEVDGILEAQHRTPLLEADWWPAGQEKKTTHLCDKWWVSQEDGQVWAFTPETRVVAEGVLAERGTK